MQHLTRTLPSWPITIVVAATVVAFGMVSVAVHRDSFGMTPIAQAQPICPCDLTPFRIAGAGK